MGQRSVANLISRSIAELKAMGPQLRPADEVARLQQILVPATEEQIGTMLSWLFINLPMEKVEADTLLVKREGYRIACRGFPRWAITEARDAFIGGRVHGFVGSFAPNSADLGREIGRRVDSYRAKLGRAKKLADEARRQAVEAEGGGPIGEETRALLAAFRERQARASADERATLISRKPSDLAVYYKRRPEEPARVLPALTREELAQVPDAPLRGMQRIQMPGFNPLPPVPQEKNSSR